MDALKVKDWEQSRSHSTAYASVFFHLRSSDDTRVAVNGVSRGGRSASSSDNPKSRVFGIQ